jgi:hypothetical protein
MPDDPEQAVAEARLSRANPTQACLGLRNHGVEGLSAPGRRSARALHVPASIHLVLIPPPFSPRLLWSAQPMTSL